MARINAWYEEGTAAGLWQDTFRSFDDGHSSLRQVYPQLTFLEAIRTYHDPCGGIFGPRVTVGVQSLGVRDGGTWAVADYAARSAIRAAHETGSVNPVQSQSFYRLLYERNFLLVAPAVGSFADTADRFRFLSPFYLHSVGRSGTDARLLKPLVFAAAALPPDLKTRMLRQGCRRFSGCSRASSGAAFAMSLPTDQPTRCRPRRGLTRWTNHRSWTDWSKPHAAFATSRRSPGPSLMRA